MEKILSLEEAPELSEACHKLIEEHFPQGAEQTSKQSVQNEFFLLLNSANKKRVFIICSEDGKDVISVSAYKTFEVKLPNISDPLHCAGIGLVVTHPKHRNKGLSTLILKHIEAKARSEGIVLCLLWSDLKEHYEKAGYFLSGCEWQYYLIKEKISALSAKLKKIEPPSQINFSMKILTDFSETNNIKKSIGPQRDLSLYKSALELPHTYAIGAYSDTNKLLAYALMGKARDLRNTVHELEGEEALLIPLLSKIITHAEDDFRILLPPWNNLSTLLEPMLGASQKTPLALMKIIDPENFILWINKNVFLKSDIRLLFEVATGDMSFEKYTTTQKITFFKTKQSEHLLQLLMGPWSIEEMQGLPKSLSQPLISHNKNFHNLPLPLYFWGFDSV